MLIVRHGIMRIGPRGITLPGTIATRRRLVASHFTRPCGTRFNLCA